MQSDEQKVAIVVSIQPNKSYKNTLELI